ncbi:unnamed protein product [Camellia sinensis]
MEGRGEGEEGGRRREEAAQPSDRRLASPSQLVAARRLLLLLLLPHWLWPPPVRPFPSSSSLLLPPSSPSFLPLFLCVFFFFENLPPKRRRFGGYWVWLPGRAAENPRSLKKTPHQNSMAEEEDVPDRNPRFCVAVHVGAGFHASSNEKALRSAMKRACLAAASILRKGDPSTNVGRGSNLIEDGHVECDASIMDGDSGAFGAVGAVSEMVSKLLLCWPRNKCWGQHCWVEYLPFWLVTERAKTQWEKYKSMLDDAKTMKAKIDGELSSST